MAPVHSFAGPDDHTSAIKIELPLGGGASNLSLACREFLVVTGLGRCRPSGSRLLARLPSSTLRTTRRPSATPRLFSIATLTLPIGMLRCRCDGCLGGSGK